MTSAIMTCTACACLCNDIELEIKEDRIVKIKNACRKGSSFIYAAQIDNHRSLNLIHGQRVSEEEAIKNAWSLISHAQRPLFFGFDNCTLETQSVAIELAQTLGATIDNSSSFCQGELIRTILTHISPTCSLDEAKDADLLIYWGSNPYHSHPRHLSRFSYYTNPKYQDTGWYPESKISCIEVKDTEISEMCEKFFASFRILSGEDSDFIDSVLTIMDGREGRKDAEHFLKLIKSSFFCVLYVGLGLDHSLDGDYLLFNTMVDRLCEWTRVAVIPMIDHSNMRGFNQLLFDKTGFVNKVNFADKTSCKAEFSFLEQVRNNMPDCIFVAGADPLSCLPVSLVKKIENTPIITIDPFLTDTARVSEVVVGAAIPGLETGGSAVRMDGTVVSLNSVISPSMPRDEEIIRRLLDMART
ncbi:MAG: hypothetical protein SWO11_02800 [Thermodesulfobacteriota bacterium]|nr:hypothetical protein [Thermodesulfobacteriota bacterium]